MENPLSFFLALTKPLPLPLLAICSFLRCRLMEASSRMMIWSSSSLAFCFAPPSAHAGFSYPKQGTASEVHAEHAGAPSSHFFRRSRHVQQAPLLLASLDMTSGSAARMRVLINQSISQWRGRKWEKLSKAHTATCEREQCSAVQLCRLQRVDVLVLVLRSYKSGKPRSIGQLTSPQLPSMINNTFDDIGSVLLTRIQVRCCC